MLNFAIFLLVLPIVSRIVPRFEQPSPFHGKKDPDTTQPWMESALSRVAQQHSGKVQVHPIAIPIGNLFSVPSISVRPDELEFELMLPNYYATTAEDWIEPLKTAELWEMAEPAYNSLFSEKLHISIQDNRPDGMPGIAFANLHWGYAVFQYKPGNILPTQKADFLDNYELKTSMPERDVVPSLGKRFKTQLLDGLVKIADANLDIITHSGPPESYLGKFGIQYIAQIKSNYVCLHLNNAETGTHHTRVGLSIFARMLPFVPRVQSVKAAMTVQKTRPGATDRRFPALNPVGVTEFDSYDLIDWHHVAIMGEDVISDQGPTSVLALPLSNYTTVMARFSAGQRPIRNPNSAVNLLDIKPSRSVLSRWISGSHQITYSGQPNSAWRCSENDIFKETAMYPDYCVNLPQDQSKIPPADRYMIQCTGTYPVGTLVFVGQTSKRAVENTRSKRLHVYQCDKIGGWTHVEGEFGVKDPSELLVSGKGKDVCFQDFCSRNSGNDAGKSKLLGFF